MYTSSIIPSRFRTVAILFFLLALVSLFLHLQYDRDQYPARFSRIFTYDSQQQQQQQGSGSGKSWYQPWRWSAAGAYQEDVTWDEVTHEISVKAGVDTGVVEATRRRVIGMQKQCSRDKRIWEREYGQANIRLAKSYEGSHARLKRVIRQALRGEELVLSTIGGSVTEGFGVAKEERWFSRFTSWFETFAQPPSHGDQEGRIHYLKVNGAIPATGSDYFSFCSALHVPHNSSLILIELSINDEYLPEEHTANIENLLRGLLQLPSSPAVILVQALEFNNPRMANGGDVHLPVAVYYDIPVVSMRNPLAPHFMRHPQLVHPYFATDWWKNPDVRHINARGHRDMANMVNALVQDVACGYVGDGPSLGDYEGEAEGADGATAGAGEMVKLLMDIFGVEDTTLPALSTIHDLDALPDYWKNEAEQARPWGPWHPNKEDDEPAKIQHGVWSDEQQLGQVPRLRFLQRWDENTHNLPLEPQCFSTRSLEHPLIPKEASGWYSWYQPDRPEKTYLFSNTTGSTFTFDIETRLGTIKMYSLRSKTFGLGSVWCWIDGRRDDGVRADGYWDNGSANIGRFTTIAENLKPGMHTVECELLEETHDPSGGHEFRIISLMSL